MHAVCEMMRESKGTLLSSSVPGVLRIFYDDSAGPYELFLAVRPIPDGEVGDAYKNRNNKSSQPV